MPANYLPCLVCRVLCALNSLSCLICHVSLRRGPPGVNFFPQIINLSASKQINNTILRRWVTLLRAGATQKYSRNYHVIVHYSVAFNPWTSSHSLSLCTGIQSYNSKQQSQWRGTSIWFLLSIKVRSISWTQIVIHQGRKELTGLDGK